jgi:hypothetical protein
VLCERCDQGKRAKVYEFDIMFYGKKLTSVTLDLARLAELASGGTKKEARVR